MIEGDPGPVSSEWQVLAPDLNEIVLGYLTKSGASRNPATKVRETSADEELT
jgi:hypothetical protein